MWLGRREFDALSAVVELGRKRHKEVVLHTHFNHPRELTEITRRGLDRLLDRWRLRHHDGHLHRALEAGHLALLDGEDVGERATVDVEANRQFAVGWLWARMK